MQAAFKVRHGHRGAFPCSRLVTNLGGRQFQAYQYAGEGIAAIGMGPFFPRAVLIRVIGRCWKASDGHRPV